MSSRTYLSPVVTTLVLLACGATALASPANGAVFVVSKQADTADGSCDLDCSLREAIIDANGNAGADAIVLPAGTYALALAGDGEDVAATGDLDVTDDLVIVGSDPATTVIDAGGLDRVLHVAGLARLDLLSLAVTGGSVEGHGGGILLEQNGTLALSTVELHDNLANGRGGGLYLAGHATIDATTIAGNEALVHGGGIEVTGTGVVDVTRSTLYGNRTDGTGGGVHNSEDGQISLVDVTVAGNHAGVRGGGIVGDLTPLFSVSTPEPLRALIAGNTAGTDPDCSGSVVSQGDSLFGVGCSGLDAATSDQVGTTGAPIDALIGSFGDHGGPTRTVDLDPASPAVDAAGDACTGTDQRSIARPQGAGCDIGALEVTTACVNDATTLCLLDGRFAVEASFATNQGATGAGQADLLSDESGTFWFFRADNRELFVKVVDACSEFDRFWFFASGLTNVEVTLTVTDTANGTVNTYVNPQGQSFTPQLDTNAFATCS